MELGVIIKQRRRILLCQIREEEVQLTAQIRTEVPGGCRQEASVTEDSRGCHLTPDEIQNSHLPSVCRGTPPSTMTSVTSIKEEERQEWSWCQSGSNYSAYTNILVRKYFINESSS